MIYREREARCRPATAAVELAICLPVLLALAVGTLDFCRGYKYAEIVANCARAGAIYSQDPYSAVTPAYGSASEAALAEWPYDPKALAVTATPVAGADGNSYVDVNATYQFQPVSRYLPGLPAQVPVTRTVRVRQMPKYPTGISGP